MGPGEGSPARLRPLPGLDGLDGPVVDRLESRPRRGFLPGGEEGDETLQLAERQPLLDRDLLHPLLPDVLQEFLQCGIHLQERELVDHEAFADDADVDRADVGRYVTDPFVKAGEQLLDTLMMVRVDR